MSVNTPLLVMLGPQQASSSAAATFDADSVGASGEVGRLQGQYFWFFCFLHYVWMDGARFYVPIDTK